MLAKAIQTKKAVVDSRVERGTRVGRGSDKGHCLGTGKQVVLFEAYITPRKHTLKPQWHLLRTSDSGSANAIWSSSRALLHLIRGKVVLRLGHRQAFRTGSKHKGYG